MTLKNMTGAAQKILIIDDEEDLRRVVVTVLTASGYTVIEAQDGLEGLAAVKKHTPDLILCDIKMPKMDGSTLLSTLKEEPEFANIPFLFLTGNVDAADIRKGMGLGADDYLTKPFTAEDVITAVLTRLQKKSVLQKFYETQFDDIKSNIAHSLPHEFRTPMNGILGLSEILKNEENIPSKDVQEMGALINKSGERLHHLLENMAFYGELQVLLRDEEAMQQLRTGASTTVTDIVQSVAAEQMEFFERPEAIRISLKNSFIQMSSLYFTKIMEELIDNALKFSAAGSKIDISGELHDTNMSIAIRDEGRGMSASQISKVSGFRQFERRFFEQQGAGLGLYLAKSLVEIHGGSLSIESTQNVGTTVTVQLPRVVEPM